MLRVAAVHVLLLAATLAAEDDDAYTTSTAACDRYTPYFRRVNALVIATSVVGGLAAALCALSALHIWLHRRFKRSLATRLVLGMILSNVVYAITDVIPTDLTQLSGVLCGHNTVGRRNVDVVAQCGPDALMFFGVWCTTMYELMMVLVSTHALRTGQGDIPPQRERALHLGCLGAGVAAFLGYYIRCRESELELAALHAATGDSNNAGWTPDQLVRRTQLQEANATLPGLLWGLALVPVTLAFLTWTFQRLRYRGLLTGLEEAKARSRAFEEADGLAAIGLDPSAETQARLFGLKEGAYTDVVKALEPYVIVIFAFAIAQVVGVVPECRTQTEAAVREGLAGDDDAALPCEYVVQFVLSWRAVALAVAYLWDPKVRAEAFDLPGLWRRFRARIARRGGGGGGGGGGGVRFPATGLDTIALVPTEGAGRSSEYGRADGDIERMGSMASKRLGELDFPTASGDEDHDADFAAGPAESHIPYQRMD